MRDRIFLLTPGERRGQDEQAAEEELEPRGVHKGRKQRAAHGADGRRQLEEHAHPIVRKRVAGASGRGAGARGDDGEERSTHRQVHVHAAEQHQHRSHENAAAETDQRSKTTCEHRSSGDECIEAEWVGFEQHQASAGQRQPGAAADRRPRS